MKQYTEIQYDDDLTVGAEDYDDSYYTDTDDLFDISTNEESPISRLKSLVLSIDWEITDEVLVQFNEELLDLKDIWDGDKVKLIYVQALEKISKYIYQKKAESHPNAIKMLLTLYHNLEKMVASDLDEREQKQLLVEDIKRFEHLKKQISSQPDQKEPDPEDFVEENIEDEQSEVPIKNQLLNLKAIVLGIDWEITDQDLQDLKREVINLENKLSYSKPKLILLQGIGTLGAYIKVKKSNAHADAFTLLHYFYDCLEKIVLTPMSLEEEKAVLFPAVEKFNQFKELLGSTISPESIDRQDDQEEDYEYSSGETIAPAFADIPEDEVHGFQAEEEALALDQEKTIDVSDHVDSFFKDDRESELGEKIVESPEAVGEPVDEAEVLSEEPDSDDIKPATFVSEIIPQENEVDDLGETKEMEYGPSELLDDSLNELKDTEEAGVVEKEVEESIASLFGEEEGLQEDDVEKDFFADSEESPDFGRLDKETALQGVDVETEGDEEEFSQDSNGVDFSSVDKETALLGVDVESEADDDSDEIALPRVGEELAPALLDGEDESMFSASNIDDDVVKEVVSEEVAGKISGFFDDDTKQVESTEFNIEAKDDIEIDTPNDIELQELGEEANLDEPYFTDSDLQLSAEEGLDVNDFFEDSEEHLKVSESEDPATLLQDEFDPNLQELEVPQPEKETTQPLQVISVRDQVEGDEDVLIEKDEIKVVAEEVVFELAEDDEYEEEIVFGLDGEDAADEEESFIDDEDVPISDHNVLGEDTKVDSELTDYKVEVPTQEDSKFSVLVTGVEALKYELDDKVINGLFTETDSLQDKFSNSPTEKTFLELFRNIVTYIDKDRDGADSDAYKILESILGALDRTTVQTDEEKQQTLLVETRKVLSWQQGKISEYKLLLNEAEESMILSKAHYSHPLDDRERVENPDEELDQERLFDDSDQGEELGSDGVRKEIVTLRQTLKDEIAALRKELDD